ncbi:MAG: cell division protein SepF [Salinirussus sp.]
MGLMSKIFGDAAGSRATSDYVELDAGDVQTNGAEATRQVRIANIGDKNDVIEIKDAVYDGDIVVADITRHTTQDRTMEHITDELKQVAREVDGDIVQKDDDQLIITPGGVAISRERLGSR